MKGYKKHFGDYRFKELIINFFKKEMSLSDDILMLVYVLHLYECEPFSWAYYRSSAPSFPTPGSILDASQ